MFRTDDTIVAVATPPGRGGIGVVRLSGPAAVDVTGTLLDLREPLTARHATFARTQNDHVVATFFPKPHSYTGDDVVEISGHGSPLLMRQIVERAIDGGARLAEPGEFTLRAFLNGRIDLVQAEAVADLIDAVTPAQARSAFDQLEGTLTGRIGEIESALFDVIAKLEASLDFPDEGYHFAEPGQVQAELRAVEQQIAKLLCDARRGRMIREGVRVTIAGKPNVGKSSLFNALVAADRAIVASTPGTTRDLVTETVDVGGMKVELVDTAGLRPTDDEVESEGIARARRALPVSDLVLVVLDRSRRLDEADAALLDDTVNTRRIVVAHKSDLQSAWTRLDEPVAVTAVSSKSGEGLDDLRHAMRHALDDDTSIARDTAALTNLRHIGLLEDARRALRHAAEGFTASEAPTPEEFVLTDLQEAVGALQEITGKRTSDDLLRHIFSRFCIGK